MTLTGIRGTGSAQSRGRASASASPTIQKTTRRPPKQKTTQEQSLECLKAIQTAVEKSNTNFSTLTKVVVETIVPWMASMQQDITEMRAETAMRWESEKEATSERERQKLERHEIVIQSLNAGVELLRRGGVPSGGCNSTEATIEKKMEAAMDWIKYQIILELIDPEKGADLYNTLSGTTLRPSKVILRGVKWALGERASEADTLRFLRQRIPGDGSSESTPKVYSVMSTAHNRVLEPIRDAFVRSFLSGLDDSSALHPKNGINMPRRRRAGNNQMDSDEQRTAEKAQQEAIALYQSGDFKLKEEYNICWERAWRAVVCEGRATANILHTHLEEYHPNAELEPIREKPTTDVEKRKISIYALGFLRLKVSKYIQKRAENDSRGMRLCHAPLWAKEVIRIHKLLKRRNTDTYHTEELEETREENLSLNGLIVRKILSQQERDDLEDS